MDPGSRVERKRKKLGESYRLRENGGTKDLDIWMRFHNRCKKGQRVRHWENKRL